MLHCLCQVEDCVIGHIFPTEFILFAVAYSKVSNVAGVKLLNKSKSQCRTAEEVPLVCCTFDLMSVVHSERAQVTVKSHYSILPFYACYVVLMNCLYLIGTCFRLSVWSYVML